jgi:hypothetical protein
MRIKQETRETISTEILLNEVDMMRELSMIFYCI